jgi:tetratricopeptide (TPR) repeat protein
MRHLALLLTFALTSPAAAQTLGRISFPNSGTPDAQAPFLRGMLLLHSFEYEDAAAAFREAQQADPDFAMAYWGEAMTYTHPLWNEQNLPAARAVLERLGGKPAPGAGGARRLERAGTPRERLYMEAAEALYFADAPKPKRDTLFLAALERITAAHPEDDEARAFTALWLMALSQGIRSVPAYMRAGAIAEEINRRNPGHPGALHYIIHAFDDPVHAPLGLHAARAYSRIAADADHAQHMTTHIFLALGMWEETVRQNAIAAGTDSANWKPGHYTSWMDYGLLQQGRYDAARRHLELMRRNLPAAPSPGRQGHLLAMRAHYLVVSERWSDPAATWRMETPRAGTVSRAMDAFALAYAALRRGERAGAESGLAAVRALARSLEGDSSYVGNRRVPGILAAELEALLLWDRGKREEAVAVLRELTREEDSFPAEFGPPDVVKPTHELLGEFLLELKRPAEAQAQFVRALELAPGRSQALLGLVRAARAAGDGVAAERALAELERNWKDADADLPGLVDLKRLRAER